MDAGSWPETLEIPKCDRVAGQAILGYLIPPTSTPFSPSVQTPHTIHDPPSLCAMFHRRPTDDDDATDDEDDRSIDPELRLRTVRTAASTLAESAAVEQRAERRKTHLHKNKKKGSFFRRGAEKKRPTQDSVVVSTGPVIPGQRRTIYVNRPLPMSEVDSKNEPLVRYPRNKVRTTSEPSPLSSRSSLCVSRAFQNIPSSRLYQRTCTNSFVGWQISISWRWLFSKVRYFRSALS